MATLVLTSAHGRAEVSLYGAQVLSYVPTGQAEVLWRTSEDFLQEARAKGKALRGGIPLCWPWFLANPADAAAPSHGLGRLKRWDVLEQQEDLVALGLMLDGTDLGWPYVTRGEVTIRIDEGGLRVQLTTTNLSDAPFRLRQALHSYLAVSDVAAVTLHGLAGATRTHVSSVADLGVAAEPFFTLHGEVEELVQPVPTMWVDDPEMRRRLEVTSSSGEMVMWNPGPVKAAQLDIPPAGERQFVCLEAAELATAVTLAPGAAQTLTTTVRVQPSRGSR